MSQRADFPIGVFDSGVGGLTVVRALMAHLPRESIIYFGDTARVPYGIKSVETIAHFSTQITQFLLEKRVKLLIMACNTRAAVASRTIPARSPVPVLDVIEAGARNAVAQTRNRRVGVVGTLTTINSGAYERAIHQLDADIIIRSQACPLFVPLVEEGWLDHAVTRMTAVEYLMPLLTEGIDTLVLGCTHYPLLRPLLQEVVGRHVTLVDSADNMALAAAALLEQMSLGNTGGAAPTLQCYVTDVPQRFQQVGGRFLGRPLENVQVVKW